MMTAMLMDIGPFNMRRLPYRLGFRWRGEYVLQPGWSKATWEIPKWAQSPSSGIIGTWKAERCRLYWHRIPVGPWTTKFPTFRSHKKRRSR